MQKTSKELPRHRTMTETNKKQKSKIRHEPVTGGIKH
jgi:hypothetical protein